MALGWREHAPLAHTGALAINTVHHHQHLSSHY